jgi:hypothetical protein
MLKISRGEKSMKLMTGIVVLGLSLAALVSNNALAKPAKTEVTPAMAAADVAVALNRYATYEDYWKDHKETNPEAREVVTDFLKRHGKEKMPFFRAEDAGITIYNMEKPEAPAQTVFITSTEPLEIYANGVLTKITKPEDAGKFLKAKPAQGSKSSFISLLLSTAFAQLGAGDSPDIVMVPQTAQNTYIIVREGIRYLEAPSGKSRDSDKYPKKDWKKLYSKRYENERARYSDRYVAGSRSEGVALAKNALNSKLICEEYLAGKQALEVPVNAPGGSFSVRYQKDPADDAAVDKYVFETGKNKNLERREGETQSNWMSCSKQGQNCTELKEQDIGASAFPAGLDKAASDQLKKDKTRLDQLTKEYTESFDTSTKLKKMPSPTMLDFAKEKKYKNLSDMKKFAVFLENTPDLSKVLGRIKMEIKEFNDTESERYGNEAALFPNLDDATLKRVLTCAAANRIDDAELYKATKCGETESSYLPDTLMSSSLKFEDLVEGTLDKMRPIAVPKNARRATEYSVSKEDEAIYYMTPNKDQKQRSEADRKLGQACLKIQVLLQQRNYSVYDGPGRPDIYQCMSNKDKYLQTLKGFQKFNETHIRETIVQKSTTGIGQALQEAKKVARCCKDVQFCKKGIIEAGKLNAGAPPKTNQSTTF